MPCPCPSGDRRPPAPSPPRAVRSTLDQESRCAGGGHDHAGQSSCGGRAAVGAGRGGRGTAFGRAYRRGCAAVAGAGGVGLDGADGRRGVHGVHPRAGRGGRRSAQLRAAVRQGGIRHSAAGGGRGGGRGHRRRPGPGYRRGYGAGSRGDRGGRGRRGDGGEGGRFASARRTPPRGGDGPAGRPRAAAVAVADGSGGARDPPVSRPAAGTQRLHRPEADGAAAEGLRQERGGPRPERTGAVLRATPGTGGRVRGQTAGGGADPAVGAGGPGQYRDPADGGRAARGAGQRTYVTGGAQRPRPEGLLPGRVRGGPARRHPERAAAADPGRAAAPAEPARGAARAVAVP